MPATIPLIFFLNFKNFARVSQAQFWHFLGSAQGVTLAPNQGENEWRGISALGWLKWTVLGSQPGLVWQNYEYS